MEKILNKYLTFIVVNTNPSKIWKTIRFVLHWISLPIKLLLIGGLGIYQILHKLVTTKNAPLPETPHLGFKRKIVHNVLQNLPVIENNSIKTYVSRVPYLDYANGTNHNDDHQASRQGTFHFIMNSLGLITEEIVNGSRMHIQQKWLTRGYKYDPYKNEYSFNVDTVSGDMLCGLNLAALITPGGFDEYDQLIESIIENDYSLLQGIQPEADQPGHEEYKQLLKQNDYRFERVNFKSDRGMWQPGLETSGNQALTVLAALRIAEIKNGNRNAGRHYRKLLWKYGYGLLSLFPTAYFDSRRNYFNDLNCLMALYVLSKLSKSKWGKLFWKIPMYYVWSLSKHWYNGYFTGLVKDCYPELISDKYITKCEAYLYREEPKPSAWWGCEEEIVKEVPVKYNDLNADEFSVRHDQKSSNGLRQVKIGLGFLACAVMLEKDPKKLISND